jgi:hypothetical protein
MRSEPRRTVEFLPGSFGQQEGTMADDEHHYNYDGHASAPRLGETTVLSKG